MASVSIAGREKVRLNDLDWQLLEILSDGRRYTPKYLYTDVEELDDHGEGWIRQRVTHLYELGMLDKVGSSSMYEITPLGRAALDLRDSGSLTGDETPRELRVMITERADHFQSSSEGTEE